MQISMANYEYGSNTVILINSIAIFIVCNGESQAQCNNRIKPWVYVRRITRSTMYEIASF